VNNRMSAAERRHIAKVKLLPCSVCNAPGPSAAHHFRQHSQYTCIALCYECHQGSKMGIHGEKRAWIIAKMDELDALNITIKRLMETEISVEKW